MLTEQFCPYCKKTLDISKFAPSEITETGYAKYCVDCVHSYVTAQKRKRLLKKKSTIVNKSKNYVHWREENQEKIRLYQQDYYTRNKEQIQDQRRNKKKNDATIKEKSKDAI